MAGYSFAAVPSRADETIAPGTPPYDAVKELSRRKAQSVAQLYPDDVVIGSDTVVEIDGGILGKPKDKTDACRMLSLLSGRTHRVYTGVCVIGGGRADTQADCTSVTFYELSEKEIMDYVNSGEPMDKAGSYGIQGRGALFVKKIDGDFYSVMGLPVSRLNRMLKALGGMME